MPACFELCKNGEPQKFSSIDDLMCAHFGVQPDTYRYYHGWYDSIGFRLALGKTFDEVIAEFKGYVAEPNLKPEHKEYYIRLIEIAEWLKANYTATNWHEYK